MVSHVCVDLTGAIGALAELEDPEVDTLDVDEEDVDVVISSATDAVRERFGATSGSLVLLSPSAALVSCGTDIESSSVRTSSRKSKMAGEITIFSERSFNRPT